MHSLLSLCELQTLGCRPVSLSWSRIPVLFPTLPTTSGNLLTSFCAKLEINHVAVVTNPQTQRLHFKKWLVCLSGLFVFFLSSWRILPSSENREIHEGVKQKGFYLCCFLPPCLEYRTGGVWGDAEPVCSGHWESLLRTRSVWAPLISPFRVSPRASSSCRTCVLQMLNKSFSQKLRLRAGAAWSGGF